MAYFLQISLIFVKFVKSMTGRINYFGVTHLINCIIDLFNRDRFE